MKIMQLVPIRYAGGYIVKKLAAQYKKMTTAKAGHFVEYLLSMVCGMQEASEISTQSYGLTALIEEDCYTLY